MTSLSEKVKKDDYLVIQDNRLVNARFDNLQLEEARLFFAALAQVNLKSDELEICTISIKKLQELLGTDRKSVYSQMKKAIRDLSKRQIELEGDDGEWTIFSMVPSAHYQPKDGSLYIELSPKLKKYLLSLNSNFTVSDIRSFIQIRSIYGIKLYWLLKQFEKIQERVFLVEDLKRVLGCDGKYENYAHFERRVLKVAHDEIQAKSDIDFTIAKVKKGRKVVGLKFDIFRNDSQQNQEDQTLLFCDNGVLELSEERQKCYKSLCELGVSSQKALQYAKSKDLNLLSSSIETTQKQANKGGFTHSSGQFIISLINKGAVVGKSTFEKKKEEKNKAEKEAQKLSIEAKQEGKKLYELFQKNLDGQIDKLIDQITEEEIKAIRAAAKGFELRAMLGNDGKVDTSSLMFRINFMRGMKEKYKEEDEDFITWAKQEKNMTVQKYHLTDSEHIKLQHNGVDKEGWEIIFHT